ncbi:potassium channel family protein [Thauera linaloolentis]|uniref:TrkA-N domain-containing protein n=1 Tax=Thauera linaloolentis (strain DSM 12138 / JCM 21573 / CCUG 41526 / CIP 105981 / IAM 15112 / NBRC 102519 / 47Lol) TaxID=1123367 RepID=N6Y9D3_THAL4|nr:potassium channel protein [Thauera linaloolentis]ENO88150.1 TrkA-N domain-containing protein [Thauera linaloolentis 47Lol = DSM 12138]MCM8565842.1 NAD-binding protein [Thauera linaloolentis]
MTKRLQPLARHHGIFFLILRRLRAPLILLITIMAISVLGLTLAPGTGENGQARYLSFFHALYFMSYTATTIGFGEIPYAFSDQQRLWVVFCIYMSVIGWTYTLGTLFALLSDRSLQQAIATQRFVRAVRRLREPFYLVCGYGETGRLICNALDRMRLRSVVVEIDETKVGEIELRSFAADVPALCADASSPEVLRYAGLGHPHCTGVIALTDQDATNLAIAIATRLMAPKLPALCRAEHRETAANMASFGTRHIINPFERFSETLAIALHAPAASQLLGWLTGLPGTTVERHRSPPRGPWIVCGHGRFGHWMVDAMDAESLPVTVIDRSEPPDGSHLWVQGDGTSAEALLKAGVQQATGIVAGTGSDIDNLSIAVTARELNPGLFVILRQNHEANQVLFDTFESDITVVPSEIIAHECLAILATPLLVPFLRDIRGHDETWCAAQLERLTQRLGWAVPEVWSERVNLRRSPALYHRLMRGETITLDKVLRSTADLGARLDCEVLYLDRDDDDHLLMPPLDTALRPGDELLLAGRPRARDAFALNIAYEHTLEYLLSGEDLPGGWIWRRLSRRGARPSKPQLP